MIISCAFWLLYVMKPMLLANMNSRTRIFLFFFFFFFGTLKLSGIEQVWPRSTLYPYFLDGISEGISQDCLKEKSRIVWRQKHSPVSLRSKPQVVLRVLL